jgi:hypothetical protein
MNIYVLEQIVKSPFEEEPLKELIPFVEETLRSIFSQKMKIARCIKSFPEFLSYDSGKAEMAYLKSLIEQA